MKFPVFFKKKLNTVIAAHPRENASPEARRMVARNPSLLALEQRFMFDGAAVNTVVDGVQEPVAQAPAERVYTQEKFSLGGNSEIQNTQLQAVVENAQEQVKDFLSKANAQALFSLFSGGQTLPSEQWAINLSQLQKEVAAGTYTVDIQLLDGRSLQGALAAFSANGPDASPVIFLNADWVNAGASTEQLTRVLIEEIGHSFDSRLNGVKDTAGDEGEAFALAVSGRTPQAYTFARISGEDDQGTVIIDGRSYSVEQANITFTQVYSGTASSLSEEANSLDNLQMVGGSGFTFTSADPLAPNFSGNNVAGTLSYTDSGSVNQNIQGVVSRLFKTNGVVEGFYFYAYGADGLIGTGDAGETGYAFVIDPSKFSNGLSRRCSSDPVDTALNNYLLGYVPPAAINDSSTSAGAVSAVEAGGAANATLGRNASGNVITNDAPSSGITVSAVGVSSATTPVSSSTNASTGTPITGTYGILTLGADGSYSYAVTNGNASVQALRTASDKLYDTFTYSIKDSSNNTSSAKLTVTIEGANDNPVAVDDFNTAKVTLLSDSTAYSSTDPLGKTATGNVLPNDTDVDQYGESKTINGVAASANFVSYASGVNSTSLIFNSTNGN
ncbi:MAG: VCBS domain-containing protein, partial [Burkholderiales bacterium]|nr:VCBS domain-containing protein [Burkholderiales bacterium]